ncbi:radical SAM/SPASM domain-containing protein [Thermoproteota archaeon]
MIYKIGFFKHRLYGVPIFRRWHRFTKAKLTSVGLEINTVCNRRCDWCPNSKNKVPSHFMKMDLFYKIIRDLKEMRYKGRISFNRFGEPLLDKRLVEMIRYARKQLPWTHIYINTNGDMLTLDLWKRLRKAGLNYANISQYDGKISDKIQKIHDSLGLWERQFFGVHTFNKNKTHNWGGNIKTKKKTPVEKTCQLPFYQLMILHDGKTVLCCMDYYGAVDTGDVSKDHIMDVWKSKAFQKYRTRLLKKDRASLTLCKSCV